ncbi:MAG: branched-chain amino acid ABC transporter permease [Candidatus Thermoplasmatota archaeon]|nr:branched-chain amino acid ABC transporter permease [Candidatus Thermoplasmatota archaeon]
MGFGIFLILALSFNLEYGYAGQPNLGKVFFYAIGAYVAGALTTRLLWALVGSPSDVEFLQDAGGVIRLAYARANPLVIIGIFVLALAVAALAGAGFGYLASYPALRLRGDFLAIVMIAVGEVGRIFALNYNPLAGGVFGLSGVPNPFIWLENARAVDAAYAVLVLGIAAGFYIFAKRLLNTPFGRLLKSVRDDEGAASVYGKRAPRVKGTALIVANGMAGVAGALYVFYVQFVYALDFIPLISFLVITAVILGGVANNWGVVIGAAFLTLLDFVTRPTFLVILGISARPPFDLNYLRYLSIGLIIVLVLMFRPQGLVPERPVETPALAMARQYARKTPKGPVAGGSSDDPMEDDLEAD